MLTQAERLVLEYGMLSPGVPVLCAVSGGADSVCLLHWLRAREGTALHAAHFDHGLRGEESRGDAAFVRELCRRWSIPFHLGEGDAAAYARREGLTLEEGARRLRYAFLEGTARELGAVVATAHTADDNGETMLWNLIRGTGLKGLCGIPPVRDGVVRPLLTTTRQEVLAYLEEQGLEHREDSSNADETYTRNRLRRQVMPVLRELNPRAVLRMGETARQLRELDGELDRQAEELLRAARWEGERLAFPLECLRTAPPSLRPRVLQGLLDRLGAGRKDFGAVHLRALLALKPGGHLDLPSGVGAQIRSKTLFLEKRDPHYDPREERTP